MTLVIIVFAAAVLCELALHFVPGLWRARKFLAGAAIVGSCFGTAGFAVWRPGIWSILLLAVSLFRALNMMRVVEARMHERYLRTVTRRTSLVLMLWQALFAAIWLWWTKAQPSGEAWLTALASLQLLVSVSFFASTLRRLRRTMWPPQTPHFSNAELPSISVAIPARNETEDLQACLESLIACDYPKLEILVLDDNSQTRRTPEIIRSFAHDGVRFIQGDEPSETWLPKNAAYDRLAHEASGEIIVFCGVDVRFAPDALRKIIAFMQSEHKQMVSILPERTKSAQLALAQGARYWWELAPPRRLFRRPSVLSTCWAIESSALKKAGGFAAVARSIVPEAYFAKRLIAEDKYSFRRADGHLGLLSAKPAAEQRATAVRTRYPQLHRRPEYVWAATLFEYVFFLLPTFGIALGGFLPASPFHGLLHILAIATTVFFLVTYELIAVVTRVNNAILGAVAFPFVVLLDLALLYRSMWQYEFATVEWKGRNVTIPAMHVIPHLPPLPDA
ncbi:MAG TPA: glycosyltransferase family 2 protein [Candidatus Saccharimonadales bacterium]